MGTLIGRALPVVLLTVLVFFNSYVWLMAATVSRPRLWVAIAFLAGIAVAFVVSGTVERVRPMLTATGQLGADDERLADTPFAAIPERPARRGLSRGERWNVVFVLAVSQTVQVWIVAIMTAGIFFVLGLILLSPQLLAEWTRNGSSDGQILGMTFPVPQALIQTSLFLGALTFMYVSARAAGDADYRTAFPRSAHRRPAADPAGPQPLSDAHGAVGGWSGRNRAQCCPCQTCGRCTNGFCTAVCRWC